ncbi:MAG: hypothetical protein J5674_05680 [Candidatus Methanomethylophilaceae archaeon]|nr:hypothetical protein [Candidatus Methanomethylophilaceae archaeon]
MSEIVVPVTTFWDILAAALDDIWLWLLSASTMTAMALYIRLRLHGRLLRWSRRSSPPSCRSSDGSA